MVRFGAMAGLIEEIAAELEAAPGDIEGSVSAWFDHYERLGDAVIISRAEEADPAVGPTVRVARRLHRKHVERQFAPQLASVPTADQRALVDALGCVSDVYTWKLLRRDMRRSRRSAEATVVLMARALIGGD